MAARWLAGLAVMTAVATSGGCDTGGTDPAATPAGPVAVSPTARPSPSPEQALYDAAGLDVCARTDLGALAGFALTVRRTDAQPPPSAAGAACLFELRGRDGHPASLRVETATPASAELAAQLYQTTRAVTVMTPDGPISGLGDEAEGFTRQSRPGFKYAEYMLHVRRGNLVVKVWLAIGGDSYAAKADLSAAVLAVTNATLAYVPLR